MNYAQLIRITVILIVIAGLDVLAYLAALKLTDYYRRKIALLQKHHGKHGLQEAYQAVEKLQENMMFAQPLFHAANTPHESPAAVVLPSGDTSKPKQVFPLKFRIGNRVEFFNSKGALTGIIMSCNGNNSKSEYRYLVNWGKDGIWWVAEDQIEVTEPKGVEMNA
jgi:hypothetical protein